MFKTCLLACLVSMSAFDSLVCVPVRITSFAEEKKSEITELKGIRQL